MNTILQKLKFKYMIFNHLKNHVIFSILIFIKFYINRLLHQNFGSFISFEPHAQFNRFT